VDFSSALLPLPWTVVHAMDERSPLHGATPASLAASDTEIIAILDGTDEVPEPNVIFFSCVGFRLTCWLRCRVVRSSCKRGGPTHTEVRRCRDCVSGRLVTQTKHLFVRACVRAEIIWDARLVPVVSQDKRSGKYVVDLSRFHDITPVVAQPPSRSTTKGKTSASGQNHIQDDDDRLI